MNKYIRLYDLGVNLEKQIGETPEKYHKRLVAIRSTQVGLISRYELEKKLDRYRHTNGIFYKLLDAGSEDQEAKAKEVILALQEEVKSYLHDYPEISEREKIRKKLSDLSRLVGLP